MGIPTLDPTKESHVDTVGIRRRTALFPTGNPSRKPGPPKNHGEARWNGESEKSDTMSRRNLGGGPVSSYIIKH
jgi:hypothetical protein